MTIYAGCELTATVLGTFIKLRQTVNSLSQGHPRRSIKNNHDSMNNLLTRQLLSLSFPAILDTFIPSLDTANSSGSSIKYVLDFLNQEREFRWIAENGKNPQVQGG